MEYQTVPLSDSATWTKGTLFPRPSGLSPVKTSHTRWWDINIYIYHQISFLFQHR